MKGGSRVKKYRDGKIKREHTVIERVWPVLEEMAGCAAITSIIPGPISSLGSRGLEITFQRFTETGLRLLAKNGSAVQELYLVTPQPQVVLNWLAEQGLVDWQPPPAPIQAPADPAAPRRTVLLPSEMVCATCGRPMAANSRAVRVGRGSHVFVHVRCAK